MKTLKLETVKRLQEYLKDVETEFAFDWETVFQISEHWFQPDKQFKTLILEEAFEFLSNNIWWFRFEYDQNLKCEEMYWICDWVVDAYWETPLEVVEKMINYLLDNKLI